MSRVHALPVALAIAACSSSDPPAPTATPAPPPADAALADVPAAPRADEPPPTPARAQPRRPGRPIEILLRSTPAGATVHVDGIAIGTTPTYWLGESGAEHEFTFSLARHAQARFRFVPITTGTLHPRLDPVAGDVDAGVPPAGLVSPPPAALEVAPAPLAVDAAPVEPDAPAPVPPVPDAGGLGPTP